MRLLITTDTVGGVWHFTKDLASGLLQQGHSVYLVSFGHSPTPDQLLQIDELKASAQGRIEYLATDVSLEWMQHNADVYQRGAAPLLDIVAAYKPDALLLSQFCYGDLPVHVPKIVIAHSDVLSWSAACHEPLNENSPWLVTYRQLVERGLSGADIVVSPTAASLHTLTRFFRITAETRVIPNGRSLPAASPTQRKLQAVCAGRLWDKAKNIAMLDQVTSPIPILLAGEHAAQEHRLGSTTFLGKLSEADLLQLFRSSAIYICTSLYEPFGLAPLEAALCGCAVLAMDIPSLREVWGDTALYFCDAPALSALLTDLSQNPNELQAMQRKSSQHAHTYTVARMTNAYVQLASEQAVLKQEVNTHAA